MATDPDTIIDPNAAPPVDPTDPAPPPVDPNTPPAGDPTPPPSDDWRSRMAGEDDKLLGFLGRYPSEKAFVEAAKKDREAARQLNLIKLPENPTDEELAGWRKQQGIPDKPEGYLETLPDGLVVGEDDRPFVDKFLNEMHGANAPKAASDAALKAYYAIVEDQAAEQAEAASAAKDQSIEILRDEWGADYRRNITIVDGFLDTLPEAVADAFRNGRDSKGFGLANNADVIKWLASTAMERNPVATVVPGAGANQASAINEEIAKIEKLMGDRGSAYWKGPESETMPARYRELINARDKLAGK